VSQVIRNIRVSAVTFCLRNLAWTARK